MPAICSLPGFFHPGLNEKDEMGSDKQFAYDFLDDHRLAFKN
jgi:hypothetical protein